MDDPFSKRFKFNRGEIDSFFEHPVWCEVERMLYQDMLAQRGELERSNPADPDGVAKILRAQGRLESDKRFYGLRKEIMLHCVAKEAADRAETTGRLELWKRLNRAQTPAQESEPK